MMSCPCVPYDVMVMSALGVLCDHPHTIYRDKCNSYTPNLLTLVLQAGLQWQQGCEKKFVKGHAICEAIEDLPASVTSMWSALVRRDGQT
jgi:hypothetical protein